VALGQLTNIEKILGDRLIFNKLNFTIDKGERVGLIGDNGAGKTTLFRLLTGAMKPDLGDVSFARGSTIGMLEQDPTFIPGNTVIDEAELAFAELHGLAHDLRDLEHQMAEPDVDLDRVMKKYEVALHNFEEAGGYAWRHRLEATLDGVGLLRSDWEKPVDSLSGGQRSRLALAKLLVANPDLMLLDEPTNHLDIAATQWLEDWLIGYTGAAIIISHDRYLLDRVGTRIAWLTGRQIKSYTGNYTAFEKQRELEELSQGRARDQQQADIDKQAEYIRRFGAGQRARQAAGRKKRLDRLLSSDKVIAAVESKASMHIRFSTDQRAGDRLLRVEGLCMSFDNKQVWGNVGFDLKRGERVGIIGPNGSGKTTLLRTLTGELDADAGDIRWGSNISIGYYDQKLDDFDPDLPVIEEVLSETEGYSDQQLRDALGTMRFSGDDVEKPMRLLSGGERARVALTKLLLQKPNVLLLDEPTNHLDIGSVDALEATLATFEGSILCVSHDRHFLDKIARRLLVLEPPTVRDFLGTWKDWNQKQKDEKQIASQATRSNQQKTKDSAKAATKVIEKKLEPTVVARVATKDAKVNPYKRPFGKLSTSELESKVARTEADIRSSEEKLARPDIYRNAAKARELSTLIDQYKVELKQLEDEYYSRTQGSAD